jgi:vancomycin resistance protein YoaR
MAQRRLPRNDEQHSPYFQEYGPIKRRRAQETPDETVPSVPQRLARRRRRRNTPLRLLIWAVVVLIGLTLAPPVVVRAAFGDSIVPGVTIQGMPVQGMPPEAVKAALEARYADFLREPVSISFGDQRWNPTLAELGARLDLDATVAAAQRVGRSPNPLDQGRDLWRAWRGGLEIAPRLTVDLGRVQGYLATNLDAIQHAPVDGALSVAAGNVATTPSQPGRQLLIDATAIDVLDSISSLEPRTVALRTRALTPTIDDAGVATGAAQAQQLLQGPLTLKQGQRTWVWEPAKLAEVMRVRRDGQALSAEPDDEALRAATARLAELVDTGSVEPRLQIDANGNLQVIQDGKTGVALRQADAANAIATALRDGNRELELPVDELRPRIDPAGLAGLGINALVGEGKTSFAGSAPYRITNIKAGASRLHGVLIAPGEEFSFNTTIGEISAENGFVEGYAIIGNRTQLEWGGGICQDSTTVFRAAFWAGLPITERHAHAFRISWYEAYDPIGMDATIYTGAQDLKFLNDTPNWLLMQVWVDEANQVLTVQLYGTPTGRTVRLDGPHITNELPPPAEPVYVDDPSKPAGSVEQTDMARGGMDITVYRIIAEGGVERSPEPFFTRFKAWPNVFVRGTGGI